MKKFIASAGLVALGAASVQAMAYAPGFVSADLSHPWTISATLNGFYDDNYLTAPEGSRIGSYGLEVSPSVAAAFSTDLTDLAARYTFGAYWYQDRDRRGLDPWDFTHQFDGYLNHTFNERYNVVVLDSFVMSKEGQLIDQYGVPYRTLENNWRNTASITLSAQLTQLLTLVLGYQNTYYDYRQDANDVYNNYLSTLPAGSTPLPSGPNASSVYYLPGGSYSATLNRDEHLILVNLKWQLSPRVVGVLGYNFGIIDYTANDYLVAGPAVYIAAGNSLGLPPGNYFLTPIGGGYYIYNGGANADKLKSSIRDSYNHYGYAGVDYAVNPDLTISIRGGAQYAIFYNDPSGYTTLSPYGNITLHYTYAPGSYVEVGFNQFINQTDVEVYNTEASAVYATIKHQLTPKLTGSVMGQFQYSKYNSPVMSGLPVYNGQSEDYYSVGLDLNYRFDRHFSADVGYEFDMLDSTSTARYHYTRNRVYIGVTAAY